MPVHRMNLAEAQELAVQINADKLWHVDEIVCNGGNPDLIVMHLSYHLGGVTLRTHIERADAYDALRTLFDTAALHDKLRMMQTALTMIGNEIHDLQYGDRFDQWSITEHELMDSIEEKAITIY